MPDGTSLKATAFFPFIPVLIHFLGKWAALLLGQVIFFISLVLLKRLFHRNGFSEVKSNIAVWLFALNPAAIYYTAVYAEPWTVFFVLLSVTFATNKRWLWAGVSGALASSTQAVGILVGAFPLILFIQSWFINKVIELPLQRLGRHFSKLFLYRRDDVKQSVPGSVSGT